MGGEGTVSNGPRHEKKKIILPCVMPAWQEKDKPEQVLLPGHEQSSPWGQSWWRRSRLLCAGGFVHFFCNCKFCAGISEITNLLKCCRQKSDLSSTWIVKVQTYHNNKKINIESRSHHSSTRGLGSWRVNAPTAASPGTGDTWIRQRGCERWRVQVSTEICHRSL